MSYKRRNYFETRANSLQIHARLRIIRFFTRIRAAESKGATRLRMTQESVNVMSEHVLYIIKTNYTDS